MNSMGYAFLRYFRTRDACQIPHDTNTMYPEAVCNNQSSPYVPYFPEYRMMECTPQTLAASPGIVLFHAVSVSVNKLSRTIKHTASILGYKIRKSWIQEDGCAITIIPPQYHPGVSEASSAHHLPPPGGNHPVRDCTPLISSQAHCLIKHFQCGEKRFIAHTTR